MPKGSGQQSFMPKDNIPVYLYTIFDRKINVPFLFTFCWKNVPPFANLVLNFYPFKLL